MCDIYSVHKSMYKHKTKITKIALCGIVDVLILATTEVSTNQNLYLAGSRGTFQLVVHKQKHIWQDKNYHKKAH